MVGGARFRWAGGLAVLTVAALLVVGCGSSDERAKPDRTTTTAVAPTTTTLPASTAGPSTTQPVATTAPVPVAYVPLYPFANLGEVADWQRNYGETHAAAQYLDANATALAFAHFLGYTGVDRVVGGNEDAKGAHVSVGYAIPQAGRTATAAVVHLVRYGSGANVPWEVVGTDDTDFTVDVPAYGSTVASPVRVGGLITGVDESIRIVVQQLHSNGTLGETAGVAAGGNRSPWSATVTFARPTDTVVIVAASTGGHVAPVERFAVTGVHV